MEIEQILNDIYKLKNEEELFDLVCKLKLFTQENSNGIFFDDKIFKNGKRYLVLKNDYTIGHIKNIFRNQVFLKSILSILKHEKEYRGLKSVPSEILKSGQFVNLSLNCCFYFISYFSNDFKQNTIDFIGRYFWGEIRKLKKCFLYEFSNIDILNVFEELIFNRKYFFQKDFSVSINTPSFYSNFKKSRWIIGNYLIDFSLPILLSNSFKEIVGVKKKVGDQFSLKDSVNRSRSIIKKYKYLSEGFDFSSFNTEEQRDLSSFGYYFKRRESKKILLLINLVINGLDDFNHDQILEKINNSEQILNKVKPFFYKNFNVFPSYEGPRIETGQWSNKSFLNTIKFFVLLETVKESNNIQWKIDTFLRYFNNWIDDINDNINYFSELDDYDKIRDVIKPGENNLIEFKSTLGLPVQGNIKAESTKGIRKSIMEEIARTILAMANSDGGDIFIGIVEKVDKIKDDEIKSHIAERDGIYFLDINYSLRKEKEDFDSKRLLLQELLKSLTKERLDFLDSLFDFHFYKVYIESQKSCIDVLDIKVKKSKKNIFIQKNNNWITLPKRLDGRVELVNPADEFQNK